MDEFAVLILSTQHKSYNDFKRAQRTSWVRELKTRGVAVYFYEGGHAENKIDDDNIYLKEKDCLSQTAKKLRAALQVLYTANSNIKLVYRTNLSSFIDVDMLLKYVDTIESYDRHYSGLETTVDYMFLKAHPLQLKLLNGVVENNHFKKIMLKIYTKTVLLINVLFRKIMPSFKYASGSGFFIGKSECEKIISNQKFDKYVDDIMVRFCVGRSPDLYLERFDFTEDYAPLDEVEYSHMKTMMLFHYRLKSVNRSFDSQLMVLLSDRKIRDKLVREIEF